MSAQEQDHVAAECPCMAEIARLEAENVWLRTFAVGAPKNPRAKKVPVGGEPEWVIELRAAAGALKDVRLAALSRSDRVIVARYHAMRFENYCRDEGANRRHALACHVAALGSLCQARRYSDMTVGELIGNLRELQAASGGAIIRSLWAIKGAVEYQAANG